MFGRKVLVCVCILDKERQQHAWQTSLSRIMDISKYIFIAIMATMLKVQTYNMKGLNNSDEYVRDIITQHQPDIICI